MNLLDLLQEAGYTPKRKAASHGGEYCCPCPFCKEGNDRFLTWPNRPNKDGALKGGRFTCRVCNQYGDGIGFLRLLYGLSYKDACALLKIAPGERSAASITRPKPKLPVVPDPPEPWQAKARVFVDWCHAQLMANPEVLGIVKARGFARESIERFRLGCCPKDFYREREDWGLEPQLKDDGKKKRHWLPAGIVIPTVSADERVIKVKVRRSAWKEGDRLPKYAELSGSKQCSSVYGDTGLPAVLILESELDALLVQQEAGDLVYCVALGGSTKPLDLDTDQLLKRTPTLLFCPDFDSPGAVAWVRWRKLYPDIRRLLTPEGKSAGDAFLTGVNLRNWIVGALDEKPVY